MITVDLDAVRQGKLGPPLTYPPVGYCIYCGSTGRLTDEHIVPYGLGGRNVLPKSSCNRCATITGKIERDCLRTMLGDLRSALLIKKRKRRPKDAYRPRPIFAHIGGKLSPYVAPEAKHRLIMAMMYAFYEPTILPEITPIERGRRPFSALWVHSRLGSEAREKLQETHGPDATRIAAGSSFHPIIFAKMIAKIGFAFAMAEARERFKPFIGKAIVGLEPWHFGHLVGGDPNPQPITKTSAEIDLLRVVSASGIKYLMARVRLFGDLGAPVYYVIVGEL